MPWKVSPVSDIRLAFVLHIRSLNCKIAPAARDFGISRKTAYKWLKRFALDPTQKLADHSRRPKLSPRQVPLATEQRVLAVRDRYRWGPRKIRAYLASQLSPLPSIRTCAAILKRNHRISIQPPTPPLQCFERPLPNDLWQCDFKGPVEIARRRVAPFTVLDDHSRFLLALRACTNQTTLTAWEILWQLFDEYGLPQAILCDNAFGCTTVAHLPSVSWFESRLLRLNIRCLHGRPYHPQTQGKIERLHATLERELWPTVRRDSIPHFDADCEQWRAGTYNTIRPHEALGDLPPLSRYRLSSRARPARLPELLYPEGSTLRKISQVGDVCWRKYRILIGRGLCGDCVRIEESDSEIRVFYASTLVRRIAFSTLKPDTFL